MAKKIDKTVSEETAMSIAMEAAKATEVSETEAESIETDNDNSENIAAQLEAMRAPRVLLDLSAPSAGHNRPEYIDADTLEDVRVKVSVIWGDMVKHEDTGVSLWFAMVRAMVNLIYFQPSNSSEDLEVFAHNLATSYKAMTLEAVAGKTAKEKREILNSNKSFGQYLPIAAKVAVMVHTGKAGLTFAMANSKDQVYPRDPSDLWDDYVSEAKSKRFTHECIALPSNEARSHLELSTTQAKALGISGKYMVNTSTDLVKLTWAVAGHLVAVHLQGRKVDEKTGKLVREGSAPGETERKAEPASVTEANNFLSALKTEAESGNVSPAKVITAFDFALAALKDEKLMLGMLKADSHFREVLADLAMVLDKYNDGAEGSEAATA